MKASEMTNEELANELEDAAKLYETDDDGEREEHAILRESAARLRTFTLLSKAHQRLANDSVDNESNILSKLKVAEDALADMLEIVENVSEYIGVDCATMAKVEKARAALAAIREEGGAR